MFQGNGINLSDFTNYIYIFHLSKSWQKMHFQKKNAFSPKISFSANRGSQLQLNVVYDIQSKSINFNLWIFKMYNHIHF